MRPRSPLGIPSPSSKRIQLSPPSRVTKKPLPGPLGSTDQAERRLEDIAASKRFGSLGSMTRSETRVVPSTWSTGVHVSPPSIVL